MGSALMLFLSTPSARRATWKGLLVMSVQTFLSTPSARRATQGCTSVEEYRKTFLSTPSARRATRFSPETLFYFLISIHALREEGDTSTLSKRPRPSDFYPRPPRGGRQFSLPICVDVEEFLSTPSARRATITVPGFVYAIIISIHALREEGDTRCP